MSMLHPLQKVLLESDGKPEKCICTAAFSGGADSTALLLCLYELRETLEISLRAVHVHHGIRGAEADRDAVFCAAFCEKYGIPFQCVYVGVPAYAEEHRLSLETAARILRYRALEQAAPEGFIATAHHAGDNAETVLFHLLRGSGMKGLRGILPRSGRLLRPLLNAEKTQILDYLQSRGQNYVEDSTNFTGESSRNRLRQEIMPLLLRENPAALAHISRTAMLLSEDEACLTQQAEAAYTACISAETGALSGLSAYPRPIRMRIYMLRLERMYKSHHIDPAFEMLRAMDAALLSGSGTVNLSGDVYAQVHRGILYMQERPQIAAETELPLQTGENRFFSDRICTAALTDAVSQNIHKADTKATLDFDKIIGSPYFRLRRADDRITLPAREHSTLLKKCVQENVPPPLRQRLYALYDAEGCIWCENIGIAARVKPTADSRRLLMLSVRAAEISKLTTEKE